MTKTQFYEAMSGVMENIQSKLTVRNPLRINADVLNKMMDYKFKDKEILDFVNGYLRKFGLDPVNEVSVLELMELKTVLEINENSDLYSGKLVATNSGLRAYIFAERDKYKEKLIMKIQGYPDKVLGPVLEKVDNLSNLSVSQLNQIYNLISQKYEAMVRSGKL